MIDQVEVKLDKVKGVKFDEKLGELKWELDLVLNSKKEIGFYYSVKYLKKMILVLEQGVVVFCWRVDS